MNRFDRTTETFTPYIVDPNIPNRNDVFTICEDRFGYVWIGTHGGGLYKFDPKEKKFTSYCVDPKNPNSLNDNYIWSIIEDRNGILWIGTESGGINQFDRDNNRFIHYKADPENLNGLSGNKILCMHEDQSEYSGWELQMDSINSTMSINVFHIIWKLMVCQATQFNRSWKMTIAISGLNPKRAFKI